MTEAVAAAVALANVRISVVMPAFNEGGRIFGNLLETAEVLNSIGGSYDIILVDDGSTDNTRSEALRAAAVNPRIRVCHDERNSGKGHALKSGFAHAGGDYIVFLDSDLDLHPRQLVGLLKLLDEHRADVVIGSKYHPGSKLNYPKRRRVISLGYALVLRLLFRLPVEDTQAGLKVYRSEVLRCIFPRILCKRFAFDVEILALAHRLGYSILEAPIVLEFRRPRRWGNIRFADIYHTAVDTLAIFFRMHILKYYDSITVLDDLAAQRSRCSSDVADRPSPPISVGK